MSAPVVTTSCVARCRWQGNAFQPRIKVEGLANPQVRNYNNACPDYLPKWWPALRATAFKKWLLHELNSVEGVDSDLVQVVYIQKDTVVQPEEVIDDYQEEDIEEEIITEPGTGERPESEAQPDVTGEDPDQTLLQHDRGDIVSEG